MKIAKMSLAAAILLGANAFAIDNVKVDGDARLYYGTDDHEYDAGAKNDRAGLFDQTTSYGEAALRLGLTADLTEGVSAGATMYAVSTLGLYNNLVSATWTGGINDNFWFGEAWVAGTAGKTTGKVGRMELDTPLVFSEQWSIVPNTFEAGVLLNQDIPDTTLVAAYVGQSNPGVIGGGITDIGTGANYDARSNLYSSFWNGAYAFGVVNNSWKPLTAQAWYFDAQQAVQAYWLQADLALDMGLMVGAQYTGIDYATALTGTGSTVDSDAYAVKVGYEMKDVFTVSAAYSQTGEDAAAGFNLDTAQTGAPQSKLYTEAWWNYGYITQFDTSAFNVTVTGTVADINLGAYYTNADQDAAIGDGNDMSELTLEVAKSFGPLDTGLYYIMTDATDQNVKPGETEGDAYNAIQVYLTYNF